MELIPTTLLDRRWTFHAIRLDNIRNRAIIDDTNVFISRDHNTAILTKRNHNLIQMMLLICKSGQLW